MRRDPGGWRGGSQVRLSLVRSWLRGLAGFNFAWGLISAFSRTGLAYERFAVWARLGDFDVYFVLATTAALPILLVVEIVLHARRSSIAHAGQSWPRRHADLLVDAGLVFGWLVFLYVEVATHIAWL